MGGISPLGDTVGIRLFWPTIPVSGAWWYCHGAKAGSRPTTRAKSSSLGRRQPSNHGPARGAELAGGSRQAAFQQAVHLGLQLAQAVVQVIAQIVNPLVLPGFTSLDLCPDRTRLTRRSVKPPVSSDGNNRVGMMVSYSGPGGREQPASDNLSCGDRRPRVDAGPVIRRPGHHRHRQVPPLGTLPHHCGPGRQTPQPQPASPVGVSDRGQRWLLLPCRDVVAFHGA